MRPRKGIILLSCTGLFVVMLLTTVVVKEFWIAYPVFFLIMIGVAATIQGRRLPKRPRVWSLT